MAGALVYVLSVEWEGALILGGCHGGRGSVAVARLGSRPYPHPSPHRSQFYKLHLDNPQHSCSKRAATVMVYLW